MRVVWWTNPHDTLKPSRSLCFSHSHNLIFHSKTFTFSTLVYIPQTLTAPTLQPLCQLLVYIILFYYIICQLLVYMYTIITPIILYYCQLLVYTCTCFIYLLPSLVYTLYNIRHAYMFPVHVHACTLILLELIQEPFTPVKYILGISIYK